MDRTQDVRERAYQIWIEEGRPEGREHEHWERARQELGVDPTSAPQAPTEVGGGEEAASAEPAVAAKPPRRKAARPS
ncbi:DUF2934 domain-containing protein [Methylopila turkensis]|uniref:DUF2934 domain-containing protein n=1 Tax=Methylopila turkensis TaxID=1437816 RepID=A0A9W6N5D8_9HYPH|nr:DUF2934 domain-containing protein [Methylopila turkensis]GLK78325.1 hypothetical protein GCM10008174_00660 [Methylopila turkensis]